MQCQCGNTKFYATEILHVSVIIDGQHKDDMIHGASGSIEDSVFKSEIIGPFTCTKCKKEYEEFK